MKKFEYKYEFEPEMYKYILSTNILNKKKDEHKIFKSLVAGYSANEIGKRYHYAESNTLFDLFMKEHTAIGNMFKEQ